MAEQSSAPIVSPEERERLARVVAAHEVAVLKLLYGNETVSGAREHHLTCRCGAVFTAEIAAAAGSRAYDLHCLHVADAIAALLREPRSEPVSEPPACFRPIGDRDAAAYAHAIQGAVSAMRAQGRAWVMLHVADAEVAVRHLQSAAAPSGEPVRDSVAEEAR